jgi:hypothetical protein
MSKVTASRVVSFTVLTLLLLTAVAGPVPYAARASSHREAPLIAFDPQADNTDVYAWVNPERPDSVTIVGSWIPFELPYGGPNYYYFGDDVAYDLHIDNMGEGRQEVTYRFEFDTHIRNEDTFLYSLGPISSLDDPDWNLFQTYTVTEILRGETEDVDRTVLAANVPTPPVNIGSKSTPDYPTLAHMAVCTLHVDSPGGGVNGYDCDTHDEVFEAGSDDIKVFAGPRDDSFFVDFSVFDLLTLRGQAPPIGYTEGHNEPIDGLMGLNVHSIVLQIPISRLVGDDSVSGEGTDPVIGVWASSSRRSFDVIEDDDDNEEENANDGDENNRPDHEARQVSRLGMPLVNEVVIPLGLKDTFNATRPSQDLENYDVLQDRVENPELASLLCGLYGVPLPRDTDGDCKTEFDAGTPRTGRADIFDIFLQGIVTTAPFSITTAAGPQALPAGFNVNRPEDAVPAEMIRLNTAISGDTCAPTPSRLGLLGGDACGFPNGRRLADDVVDIEVLAVAGAAWSVLVDDSFTFNPDLLGVLTDGVDANDKAFESVFPYLADPHRGQEPMLPNINVTNAGAPR